MSIDYLVSSLQPLAFDAPPPYTAEEFAALAGPVELHEDVEVVALSGERLR